MQQNGHTSAEIQEEVALTNMGTTATAEKRHSHNDKLHFPRANLQTITVLGEPTHFLQIYFANTCKASRRVYLARENVLHSQCVRAC